MITFHASLFKTVIDDEGEVKLTLRVPASDLAGPISTITLLKKPLIVTIDEDVTQ